MVIVMIKPIVVTKEGLKELENELETLKTVTRNEIAEKIKVARGFGDLSENSEYDEAKNEQAKVEARIVEIEAMLKNIKVIEDDEISNDEVSIGHSIKVLDLEYDEELEFKIVGSAEANPSEGKISDESPVGAALIGSRVGDEVAAETPNGYLKFKVLEINR